MPRRPVDDGEVVVVGPAVAVGPRHSPWDPTTVQATIPGVFDLVVYQGDTMEWVFQLFGSGVDPVTGGWVSDGWPVDITGWVFKAEIRSGSGGGLLGSMRRMVPVFPGLLPESRGYEEAVAAEFRDGWLRMRLTADQSRSMRPGGGLWDLEAVTSDGWVKTLIRGSVAISGDITSGVVSYSGGA